MARAKNWGPVGTFEPTTWTSHVPWAGEDNVMPRRLSRLLLRFVQVPEGSLTAKSKSLTRFVLADGVEAGSVHDRARLMSAALAGTLNDQPRSALVMTDSPCNQEVLMACVMFTSPHPSWLLGAASPAPFDDEEY